MRTTSSLIYFQYHFQTHVISKTQNVRLQITKRRTVGFTQHSNTTIRDDDGGGTYGGTNMGPVEEAHNVNVVGSTGGPVVVLGHGFGTDQSVWKHLVPHLLDHYRIVLFDNMGAGTTNPDYFDFDRYSTIEGWAYDLLAILEDLQITSCIYVGHSVSAMIGLIASIIRPDLFFKLILLSASPGYKFI